MSRRGNCHDNAVVESFLQLLKRERIKRKIYLPRDEARSDIFEYIEMFYIVKHRHGFNGQRSPVDYEKFHQQMDVCLKSRWLFTGSEKKTSKYPKIPVSYALTSITHIRIEGGFLNIPFHKSRRFGLRSDNPLLSRKQSRDCL